MGQGPPHGVRACADGSLLVLRVFSIHPLLLIFPNPFSRLYSLYRTSKMVQRVKAFVLNTTAEYTVKGES